MGTENSNLAGGGSCLQFVRHITFVKCNNVKLNKTRYACNHFRYKYLLYLNLGPAYSFSSEIPEVTSFRLKLEMGSNFQCSYSNE